MLEVEKLRGLSVPQYLCQKNLWCDLALSLEVRKILLI